MSGKTYCRANVATCIMLIVLVGIGLTAWSTPVFGANDRTLYLHYTHTKQTAKITFKRDGRYDTEGLEQLNWFLRDWRRKEATGMDPRLFDLIWEIYQEVGATRPIHVVSAYRSPETNRMLRSRSSAVAKNSNHTRGLAMDFYIPGIPVSKLRAAAMKKQSGGVGYYPTSGSPFVHLDTGSVRAWPRMSTAQLKRLFPDGKTMHIPSNGVILSKSGYAQAELDYKRCRQVPCSNRSRIAAVTDAGQSASGRTLLDILFGRNKEKAKSDQQDTEGAVKSSATILVAALKQPPPQRPNDPPMPDEVSVRQIAEPVPIPGAPPARSSTLTVASVPDNAVPEPPPATGLELRTGHSSQSVSRPGAAVSTAYAPQTLSGVEGAQKALEIILARKKNEAALSAAAGLGNDRNDAVRTDTLVTASISTDPERFHSILDMYGQGRSQPGGRRPKPDLPYSVGAFLLPDLEHLPALMSGPARFHTARYATLHEPDEIPLVFSAVMGGETRFGFDVMPIDDDVGGIVFGHRSGP